MNGHCIFWTVALLILFWAGVELVYSYDAEAAYYRVTAAKARRTANRLFALFVVLVTAYLLFCSLYCPRVPYFP